MALLKDCWDERWPFESRLVWEIIAEVKVAHIRSIPGTGEVETVAHSVERRSMHVIARSEQDARLAWWHRHHRDGENKIITCEAIASVDAEIRFESK